MSLKSINPATGEKIKDYETMSDMELADILSASHDAFLQWRYVTFKERAKHLKKAGGILRAEKERLAKLITMEMGKPIGEARAEIEKCAWACDFYADQAETFLAPEIVETGGVKSYVSFQPLGTVLAIMPWNFPFWQVFRFAAPTTMAGNAILLKHAPTVTGCALAIQEIFCQAGFPEPLFRILRIEVKTVEMLIRDKRIVGVTLTGSPRAGRAVAALAGASLKKTVLELGGSDPYIILSDADLESAAEACVASRLLNTGQTCISAKRFIVISTHRKEFEKLVVEKMRSKKMGNPFQDETDVGPLARFDLRDNLHRQVCESVRHGARLLLGGDVPSLPGAYYPPTVLTDVGPGQPAYCEELFGPVAAIIAATDEKEAIHIANDTVYGLGSAVFTKDTLRGEQIALKELEAGSCFVNAPVHSDPRLPFGGIKQSGYGRELSGYGIREFTNIKTIYVKY